MLHFDMTLRAGPAHIALPSTDGRHDAVSHALALRVQQPLLDALEIWLGEGLDPTPANASASLGTDGPADVLQLQLADIGSLTLPVAALRAPLPAALRETGALRWPSWPCEVLLDSVPAERFAADALHPGCLLLMPRSFGPVWPAQLRPMVAAAAGATPACAARWLTDPNRLELRSAPLAPMAPAHDDDWSIVLGATPSFSAELLLGLATQPLAWPTAPGADGLVLQQHGRRVATGRLLAAGRGFGLRIDAVVADAAALV